jgi:hypothetical protein
MNVHFLGMSFDEPGQLIALGGMLIIWIVWGVFAIKRSTRPMGVKVLGGLVFFVGSVLLAALVPVDGYGVAILGLPMVIGHAILGFK